MSHSKFVTDHGSVKMFTRQGVQKNSGETKKLYFQNSNQWDATQVVLNLEARQNALCGRNVKKENIKKKNRLLEN